MSYQNETIIDIINKIKNDKIIIPAIQRDFVWNTEQIEKLFDSIMNNYPINSFLMWKVNEGNKQYQYYTFIKNYKERYKTLGERLDIEKIEDGSFIVLDGQQRLTSLYIGLCGSYAFKLYKKHWINNEENLPTRELYLQLNYNQSQEDLEEDSDNTKSYNFKFLSKRDLENESKTQNTWFKVADLLILKEASDINKYCLKHNIDQKLADLVFDLHNRVFNKAIISYYLEKTESYSKALQIFIRTNSGGTFLSYAELIMSTIALSWESPSKEQNLSAKEEFLNLKKEVQNIYNIEISNDLIIRSYLMCRCSNVKFDVDNFTHENALDFKNAWDRIKKAILLSATLMQSFGHNNETLRSKNALLPIIQYLFITNKDESFINKANEQSNRLQIQYWLNISLIKGFFGGQSNESLKIIKDIIHKEVNDNKNPNFPKEEIIKRFENTNKSLALDTEYLQNILYSDNGGSNKFILYLIYYAGQQLNSIISLSSLHKDHIFPISWFSNLEKHSININDLDEEDKKYYQDPQFFDSILNFQLLHSSDNTSKNASSLNQWITDKKINLEEKLIPKGYTDFKDFPKFIQEREKILLGKLKKALGL